MKKLERQIKGEGKTVSRCPNNESKNHSLRSNFYLTVNIPNDHKHQSFTVWLKALTHLETKTFSLWSLSKYSFLQSWIFNFWFYEYKVDHM